MGRTQGTRQPGGDGGGTGGGGEGRLSSNRRLGCWPYQGQLEPMRERGGEMYYSTCTCERSEPGWLRGSGPEASYGYYSLNKWLLSELVH